MNALAAFLWRPLPGPPNGGWGWVVTLASFTVHVVVLGLCYSFGVLYRALLADASFSNGGDKAGVAWVGSIATCLMLLMGVVTGELVLRFGHRAVTGCGGILLAAGLVASSYAPTLGAMYFTYGIMCGTGFSLAFAPSVMVVNRFFTTYRSLAVGIAVAGSGAGTFIFASLNDHLIATMGWRACLRVDAAIAIVLVSLSAVTYRPVAPAAAVSPPAVAKSPAPLAGGEEAAAVIVAAPLAGGEEEAAAVTVAAPMAGGEEAAAAVTMAAPLAGSEKEAAVMVAAPLAGGEEAAAAVTVAATLAGGEEVAAAATAAAAAPPPAPQPAALARARLTRRDIYFSRPFLQAAGGIMIYAGAMFVPITHLPAHIVEAGYSSAFAAAVVAGIGAGNIGGRVIMGRLADTRVMSALALFQISMLVAGAVTLGLAWLGHRVEYLCFFAATFGFSAGGIVSLSPSILIDAMGLEALPIALGATYTIQTPTVLLLPPLAGWVRATSGDYTSSWIFSGVCMAAGAAFFVRFPRHLEQWYVPPPESPAAGAPSKAAVAPGQKFRSMRWTW